MTLRLSNLARTASVAAIAGLLDADAGPGTIKVYSGAQPANPDTAPSGTLLATFTLADPAFAAGAAGVQNIDATPVLSTTGVAAGTAGWFRAADQSGDAVFDGACGTSGAELNLNTTTISVGLTVEITGGTITQPV